MMWHGSVVHRIGTPAPRSCSLTLVVKECKNDSCSFGPPSGVKGMLRRLGSPALTNALSAHTADDLCEASAYRFDEPPKKSRLDDLPSKCKLQIKM